MQTLDVKLISQVTFDYEYTLFKRVCCVRLEPLFTEYLLADSLRDYFTAWTEFELVNPLMICFYKAYKGTFHCHIGQT